MNKITKMLVVACATMMLGSPLFAQDAPKAVPGAVLSVYSITDDARPRQDVEPIAVIVDGSQGFSQGNLSKNEETANLLNQRVFLVWKGYVSIPAKGNYTFSISYSKGHAGYNQHHSTILQINGKDFLGLEKSGRVSKINDSKSLLLEQGDYEITIIQRGIDRNFDYFTLRMWNKANPLKKISITPASMVHAE